MTASAARHGVDLECFTAPYGQIVQAALAPDSALNRFGADAVLIALDHRALPLASGPCDDADASNAVAASLAFVTSLLESFRAHGNAICMVQTLEPPLVTPFGSFDAVAPGTLRSQTAASTPSSQRHCRTPGPAILDYAESRKVRPANWFDDAMEPGQACLRRAPGRCIAYLVRDLWADARQGRRCLVLDLDNTLWGGVIGDDGLEGHRLGQGDATGDAFIDVQRSALELRERGIVLAVSSKNDEHVARAAFAGHPEMLLREDAFRRLPGELDRQGDQPRGDRRELCSASMRWSSSTTTRPSAASCAQLCRRSRCPSCRTIRAVRAALLAAGYFEAVAFSDEDRNRARLYEDNARRVALHDQVGDLDDYLASLDMVVRIPPVRCDGRQRASRSSSTSRTSSTLRRGDTPRRTSPQIEADSAGFTLQVRLGDRFGDNGMIGVVVCRPAARPHGRSTPG